MKRALALTACLAVAAATLAAAPATAAVPSPTFQSTATSWAEAASKLGTAGSLWTPTRRLGLTRQGAIDVLAQNLTVVDGAVVRSSELLPATAAAAQYGTGRRMFTIAQKWADTTWAVGIADSWHQAPVGTARVLLGPRLSGQPNRATVRIFANCWRPASNRPSQPPRSFRCGRSDVLAYGGVMTLTARPVSTMMDPGNTTIRIESRGLTYAQLLVIGNGLSQTMGSLTNGTGSAQMEATCRQMVDGKMTTAQAETLATGNGYTTRVVQQDGVDLPATADFRYDRINIATTGGVVTDCISFG